jgi:hypothetical protein
MFKKMHDLHTYTYKHETVLLESDSEGLSNNYCSLFLGTNPGTQFIKT